MQFVRSEVIRHATGLVYFGLPAAKRNLAKRKARRARAASLSFDALPSLPNFEGRHHPGQEGAGVRDIGSVRRVGHDDIPLPTPSYQAGTPS